jgi:hypothetical protein
VVLDSLVSRQQAERPRVPWKRRPGNRNDHDVNLHK